MYTQPFFVPGSRMMPSIASGAINNMARGAMMPAATLNNTISAAGRGGLFSKLGGAASAIRSFNWGGLINNTSKTLGIINQTIPLVRQVGPMFSNMRSMLRVASLFKDETDNNFNNNSNSKTQVVNNSQNNSNMMVDTKNQMDEKKEESSINYNSVIDGSPTFFIS